MVLTTISITVKIINNLVTVIHIDDVLCPGINDEGLANSVVFDPLTG
jgi:hypothetical protein